MRAEGADGAGKLEKHAPARRFGLPFWANENHRTIHDFLLQSFGRLQHQYDRIKKLCIERIQKPHNLLLGTARLPILDNVDDEGQSQSSADSRQRGCHLWCGRYSIGNRDPLRYDSDGSLMLYIQRDSPGRGMESNWLPTPSIR